jgi:hypothetical protein
MKAVISTPGSVPQLRGQKGFGTIWTIRGLLLLQIVIFLSMVSIHVGLLIAGYRHRNAATAESVFAAVLVAGLLLTWSPPRWSRGAATAAQSFGILGVLVGLFTIALGIGPRTMLDLALNAALLLTLIAGLAITLRKP